MASYQISKDAQADLDGIADRTFDTWGAAQAVKYLAELDEAFDRIAAQPKLGRQRSDVPPGRLCYRVKRHMIFFVRFENGDIEIDRVLYDGMDFARHL